MKATGIVRRIDELGRVVVPKEIRSFKLENVHVKRWLERSDWRFLRKMCENNKK